MDTKLQIPESIIKLLESTVKEDVILGVIWTYENMGVEWCLENYNFVYTEPSKNNFPTKIKQEENRGILVFPDVYVLIGGHSIEASIDTSFPEGKNIIYTLN